MSGVAARRVVYVVDDDRDNLNIFSLTFGRKFAVTPLSSGAEAIALVERVAPDVIVSDQRMPGMSGIELLERVREISPTTRRFLLTAYADAETHRHNGGGVCGCIQQHFDKPFDKAAIECALSEDDLQLEALERGARAAHADANRVAAAAAQRHRTTDVLFARFSERIGALK